MLQVMICHNIKSKVMKNLELRTGYLTSEKFDNNETSWLKYGQGLIMFDGIATIKICSIL